MKLITLSGLGNVQSGLDIAKGVTSIIGDSATTGLTFYNAVAQTEYNMAKLELDSEAKKLESELKFALLAQKTANTQADRMQAQALLVQAEKKRDALYDSARGLAQEAKFAVDTGVAGQQVKPIVLAGGALALGAVILLALKK